MSNINFALNVSTSLMSYAVPPFSITSLVSNSSSRQHYCHEKAYKNIIVKYETEYEKNKKQIKNSQINYEIPFGQNN